MDADTSKAHEERHLSRKHLTMIAIGGIIGSGLFVGSSAAIATAGPAIIVSYSLAGMLIFAVIHMLGKMAAASPLAGPFTEHIRAQLGDLAGFVTAWMYWLFWVIAVALEALAGAHVLSGWIVLPIWSIAALLIGCVTAFNLFSIQSFGESEFWLSFMKVAALLIFIVLGLGWVGLEVIAQRAPPPHLYIHGGFAPFGAASILSGVVAVILALVGAEIVTVAAAESREGEAVIARLSRTLILRILLFYIVSIALIVSAVPWQSITPGSSPFALALTAMGWPHLALLMNVVVIVAVLSCMNSGVYVCSRMLVVLAKRGEATDRLTLRNARGIPTLAVLITAGCGLAIVATSFSASAAVFLFLVNAAGGIMLIAYGLLVAAYLRFSLIQPQPMILSALMACAVIAAMITVMIAMASDPVLSPQIWFGLLMAALLGTLHLGRKLIKWLEDCRYK